MPLERVAHTPVTAWGPGGGLEVLAPGAGEKELEACPLLPPAPGAGVQNCWS